MRDYLLYPLLLASIMSLARMGFRSFKEWTLYGRGGGLRSAPRAWR